jgi:CheY-like chemotaxis protein
MRRTILLADDSPTIRRLVTQTFADGDFDVVSVSNGEAAVKTFEETRPSVVLADIYMPGKNGYEVCTYIRKHPSLNTTPVVLLVGAFDAFDEDTAKRAGATANITKPFEPGALIELVMSVLPEPPAADPAPEPASAVTTQTEPVHDDLLGLNALFNDERSSAATRASLAGTITDDDIERIADRVIQKLSTQVIENIAWDIVPDITERVVRDELKRIGQKA